MTSVLVVDDNEAVRAGLVLILESAPGLRVVGEAADGVAALARARELRPDVVLMDVRMPRMDGITATRELAGLADVLVLTTFDHDEYVYGALRAGAAGFLLKNTDADTLIDAVRTVARGEGLIAPEVTRRVITAFAGRTSSPPGLADLTDREREVLTQLGLGRSNQEISAALGTTAATTKTHVSRILTKLGVRSRVQAAIVARESGLVHPLADDGGPSRP
ncbi:response regulator transcription factor [Paractinoplanes lichenicola]|uniref:Response regulator transcription factor n=1 Tax=Paractinoplanes lichenicola TaxID=2802976 RepID=A0ABS1W4E8_9ACTN|nr:response regulator transcription factor [Actinoplanes lichenicola]MBL7261615.1 response regulator transcription factor [Actinoplanes lichenicola]